MLFLKITLYCKVVWQQIVGEVGKFITFCCQFS